MATATKFPSDIEIAQTAKLKHINEIEYFTGRPRTLWQVQSQGSPESYRSKKNCENKLILVTAQQGGHEKVFSYFAKQNDSSICLPVCIIPI